MHTRLYFKLTSNKFSLAEKMYKKMAFTAKINLCNYSFINFFQKVPFIETKMLWPLLKDLFLCS